MTFTPKAVTPSGARTLRNPYPSPNSSTCPNAWPTVLEPIRLAFDRVDRSLQTRAGVGGVSVDLPPTWDTTVPPRDTHVDPVTRLVVASAAIEYRAVGCQIADYSFASDSVAL